MKTWQHIYVAVEHALAFPLLLHNIVTLHNCKQVTGTLCLDFSSCKI